MVILNNSLKYHVDHGIQVYFIKPLVILFNLN